jgi:hypothetical protein
VFRVDRRQLGRCTSDELDPSIEFRNGLFPNLLRHCPDGPQIIRWHYFRIADYTEITTSRQMCLSCSDPSCDRIITMDLSR